MTTTIITELSTTITSTLTSTQTAIVKGVLDLSIQTSIPLNGGNGITFAGKAANPETTVSTITSSSTTTSSASSSKPSSSHINFGNNLLTQGTSASNGSNPKIGMAIGIPVAIIAGVLIIVAFYFYLRYRKNYAHSQDAKLQRFYDDKYNYRISPLNESTSPYNLKTVYQLKTQPGDQFYRSNFDNQSSTIVPTTHNSKVPSIKEIPQGYDNSTKWATPIHKWFNNMSKSAMSSRASLRTGIFSPKTPALREFNLKKQTNDEFNEKSPILPSFPEKSYGGHDHSFHSIESSPNGSIKQQVVRADTTRREIILQHPSNLKNKKKSKPLPKVPQSSTESSIKSLAGLEQIVMERMIPTTPEVDFAKYKNDKVYMVIKSYERNLADELSIKVGEYIRILARHTDGWCLAEKCNQNGEVLYQDTNNYINEGRGVIPELCLQGNK